MANISLYINEKASKATSPKLLNSILEAFKEHNLSVRKPENMHEFLEMIAFDKNQKTDTILSIGGDGTAHTIAQHIIGTNTKLLIIPKGTANDLANELGLNSNLEEMNSILKEKNTKALDTILINGKTMITCGGIGIASRVASIVNTKRKTSKFFKLGLKVIGKKIYGLKFLSELLLKPLTLHSLYVDSKDCPLLDKRVKTPMLFINNQSKLAGSFNIAPETKNDDGKFNVTIFLHQNKISLLLSCLQFFLGKYPKNDPKIISFETDHCTLTKLDEKPCLFFGDGEIFKEEKEYQISIKPKSLNVIKNNEDINLCSKNPFYLQ